ncbi:MAG TPA: ATP-binding cassette domain-containing protein [Tepidisphaeraceae bacterium]|nr:ATP-binding cassette domain-containing protein [Tepidisphaeraceae bacterium]
MNPLVAVNEIPGQRSGAVAAPQKTPARGDVITLEKLVYAVGGRRILDGISGTIGQGEFVSVLGPNGAGKSTLLKLLLGLLRPNSGSIHVLGSPPRRGNPRIGYVPQHRVLEVDTALRARDVVGFGLDGNRWGIPLPSRHRTERIERALADVNARHLKDEPIGHLSGGEQQRLLIAQALISNPGMLLLDEPFSNLDLAHEKEIVGQISHLAKDRNITVMLVSHDINPLLKVTDRVLFLSNGQAALGSPGEVINSQTLSRLYRASVEVAHVSGRIFVLGVET